MRLADVTSLPLSLPDTTDHLIVCSGIIVPSGRRVHEVVLMLPGCSPRLLAWGS